MSFLVDYTLGASITRDAARRDGIVAVRSLTKFYGCPALRVGYAVASPGLACDIRRQLAPWPVTTLAANALVEAVSDDEYAHATLASNTSHRSWLTTELTRMGFRVFPGAANFLRVEVPSAVNALDLWICLFRKWSILVRECDSFEGLTPGRHIRVAVRGAEDNRTFVRAVRGALVDLPARQVTRESWEEHGGA